jgi:hypothetical protein
MTIRVSLRAVAFGLVCAATGAGVAAGVMVWEPWADDFDPAKCEAALRSFQEAKSLADDKPSDFTKDLLSSAGDQWTRECHLEWKD